jgi:hypothetical protein
LSRWLVMAERPVSGPGPGLKLEVNRWRHPSEMLW